jgi:hypothetical protein
MRGLSGATGANQMYELNDTEKGILAYGSDEELEDLANRIELYYDQPEVIAGEVFQDKLDMYRNEH